MGETLMTYLQNKSLLNQQIALEKLHTSHVDLNMLMLADNEDCFSSNNRYTLLNWACYYRFEEVIAFLLLRGGDPFLQTQEICETEPLPILHSVIENVLHWYSKLACSERCAHILAMINYCGNPVTDIGRDPDGGLTHILSTMNIAKNVH